MEEKKPEVIFLPKTENSIFKIRVYIEERGYPESAKRFSDLLYDFGYSLNIYHKKYPVCKQKALAKRKMRCAVLSPLQKIIF